MAKGYSSSADILLKTREGQSLDKIWDGFAAILEAFNAQRSPLTDLLSFRVTEVIEDVVEAGSERFEPATEFGLPKSIRPAPATQARAFPFSWYDMRQGYTFQFLAGNGNTSGASAKQIDAVMQMAMEADNRLEFEMTMKALFNSANRTTSIENVAYTVTALYNADSLYIPPFNGVTFNPATHTHYVASGAVLLDSTDLDNGNTLLTEHGYDQQNGYTTLVLCNKTEADVIKTFRRGVANNNGAVAIYDFIPATGTGFLLPIGWEVASGSQPGNTFAGMNVVGTYGPYLIVEHGQIPTGYLVFAASAGRSTNLNIVGLREHEQESMRGLVLKPGNNNAYPLIDSAFIKGIGSGVARRGAAAVMQLTAGAYAVPAAFAWSA